MSLRQTAVLAAMILTVSPAMTGDVQVIRHSNRDWQNSGHPYWHPGMKHKKAKGKRKWK